MVQPVISFDLYLKYLKNTKPEFSTFFTNHVAGMMHRYWKYLFPNATTDEKTGHSQHVKNSHCSK